MAVLDPIKLVITNYPADKTENLSAENNPEDENGGHRSIAFGNELWIERDDFMENPSPKYFRLGVGLSVRLKHAYVITCTHFDKDENGNITTVYCTYNPDTKSGQDQTGIKVKGTIHWVEAKTANTAEVHLYDRLFTVENPGMEDGDILEYINKDSLKIINNAMIEPSLLAAKKEDYFQFVRMGYFCLDTESTPEKIKFNRTVTLKDTWAKKN